VGILWALAFPNLDMPGVAWVVPGLLLTVTLGTTPAQGFRLGFLTGFAAHLTSLYWLLLIPVAVFPILGWVALSAYVALYPAVWAWTMVALWRRSEPNWATADAAPKWLAQLPWPGWFRRWTWCVLGGCIWVALEWMRVHFLGGFPWNLLGVSQHELIPLMQVASITGVYGLSFLIAWFSLGLFCSLVHLLRCPAQRSAWLVDIAPPLLVIFGLFLWGWNRLRADPPEGNPLRVAVIQPSIPQTTIWDTNANAQRFAEVLELTREALAEKPDLLLWPEAAVPELLRWDEATYDAITGLTRSNQVWMILGADDAELGDTPEEEPRYYNSAWLVSPAGRIAQTYRKQKLVAFGEEVPFAHWLPFLKWFTPITGAFTRGTGAVTFVIEDPDLKVAPSICFEDVFPALVRRSVRPDTDLLVNLTNDGWFREGAAQRQQAAAAVFRAVENGRPIVRCTNNGLTCWADPFGRIREQFTDAHGSIHGSGWTVFQIDTSGARGTFYGGEGDVFAGACTAAGGVALLMHFIRRSPARAASTPSN